MRLALTGRRVLALQPAPTDPPATGMARLTVAYCGVCRTDAKMWHEGHRDLVLPRVPGHEILARDENGRAVTVWPGRACGRCTYCRRGRENLCEEMAIMGFHFDGGFSESLLAPVASLIPVPDGIAPHRVCFAEPVGCVFNAFEKLGLTAGQRLIVLGGGTMGLIAARLAQTLGVEPLVIEKQAEKRHKAAPFLRATGIACEAASHESEFDAVINACADDAAFCQGITKLAKGGQYAYFSGLAKNRHIETNLINLVHYKEAAVHGAYGLTRDHMVKALTWLTAQGPALEHLVEAVIPPEELAGVLPAVLAGKAFKYILDLRPAGQPATAGQPSSQAFSSTQRSAEPTTTGKTLFEQTCAAICTPDPALEPAARQKMDNKTKPLGALGRMEELALQLSLIQQNLDPVIDRKALFVFAADHGITEEGVSAYPAEVTAQMVAIFLAGGAAINVLCRHHGIDMAIVDMGVDADLPAHPMLQPRKVRRGTRNFALEPAMTRDEAIAALEAGMACFLEAHGKTPIQIVGLGEMGIGNTTSAAAIISAATGLDPRQATGRGTGIDDAGVEHKAKLIARALAFHQPDSGDGLEILCKVGGLEIAGIAGAALAAASVGVAVVLDGVISTAAGLIAHLISPQIAGYLISGHRSVEPAHQAALKQIGLSPVLDLQMRLGEGTGAALTMEIVAAACRIMREMASFEEAGVSGKT